MKTTDCMLLDQGLRKAGSLEELVKPGIFFADSNIFGSGQVTIYPVTRKANLTHDLLNLYGTHWRYLASPQLDIAATELEEGDLEEVYSAIRRGEKKLRYAGYAFTKKYLDLRRSLWVFVPGTAGWSYQGQLAQVYKADYDSYIESKKKISKAR